MASTPIMRQTTCIGHYTSTNYQVGDYRQRWCTCSMQQTRSTFPQSHSYQLLHQKAAPAPANPPLSQPNPAFLAPALTFFSVCAFSPVRFTLGMGSPRPDETDATDALVPLSEAADKRRSNQLAELLSLLNLTEPNPSFRCVNIVCKRKSLELTTSSLACCS